MVVRRDGERLDARSDQELGEDALDLGLAALEVVTGDERAPLLGEPDDSGDERVLGSTVDEGGVLEDGCDGEEGRGGNLGVGLINRLEKVGGRVVDARKKGRVALGVGGPEDDNSLEVVGGLQERRRRLATGECDKRKRR